MNSDTDTNERLVRHAMDSLVRGELASARDCFGPDFVYHLRAYQRTVHGADAFIELLSGYYRQAQNFRSDVLRLVASGDSVAIEGHESYELDGKAVSYAFASWVRLSGGRIVEWADYFDSRTVAKQLKAGAPQGGAP
jgi:ketosteroid isomerase-like protein